MDVIISGQFRNAKKNMQFWAAEGSQDKDELIIGEFDLGFISSV